MKKKVKRIYTRRSSEVHERFVVYVTFPSSPKEYCYFCNIPGVVQGSQVIANGTRVIVHRTAQHDQRAVRWVEALPDQKEIERRNRRKDIIERLSVLQAENSRLELWQKLAHTNTEAKRLLAEYRRIAS